ncbi:MAG: metallophosphoesterase family protein [Polyangiales bacterium]
MKVRRFGAIGDVHGEDRFLAAALDHMRGTDAVLAVGDIVDGRGDVDRCCALLKDHGALVVRGNHERWVLEDKMRELPQATMRGDLAPATLEFLRALPATRTLETVLGKLMLCHGVGDDDMIRLLPEDEGYVLTSNDALQNVLAKGFELMVCGHTHRPMVRSIHGLTVINAGTLHYADTPSFVEVDLEAKVAQYFTIDDHAGGARVLEGLRFDFGAPGQDVWGTSW